MKNLDICHGSASSPDPIGHTEYLRPREAARFLGLSESTLAKLRMRSNHVRGPAFSRPLGRYVVYRRRDLEAWLERSLVGGEMN